MKLIDALVIDEYDFSPPPGIREDNEATPNALLKCISYLKFNFWTEHPGCLSSKKGEAKYQPADAFPRNPVCMKLIPDADVEMW